MAALDPIGIGRMYGRVVDFQLHLGLRFVERIDDLNVISRAAGSAFGHESIDHAGDDDVLAEICGRIVGVEGHGDRRVRGVLGSA